MSRRIERLPLLTQLVSRGCQDMPDFPTAVHVSYAALKQLASADCLLSSFHHCLTQHSRPHAATLYYGHIHVERQAPSFSVRLEAHCSAEAVTDCIQHPHSTKSSDMLQDSPGYSALTCLAAMSRRAEVFVEVSQGGGSAGWTRVRSFTFCERNLSQHDLWNSSTIDGANGAALGGCTSWRVAVCLTVEGVFGRVPVRSVSVACAAVRRQDTNRSVWFFLQDALVHSDRSPQWSLRLTDHSDGANRTLHLSPNALEASATARAEALVKDALACLTVASRDAVSVRTESAIGSDAEDPAVEIVCCGDTHCSKDLPLPIVLTCSRGSGGRDQLAVANPGPFVFALLDAHYASANRRVPSDLRRRPVVVLVRSVDVLHRAAAFRRALACLQPSGSKFQIPTRRSEPPGTQTNGLAHYSDAAEQCAQTSPCPPMPTTDFASRSATSHASHDGTSSGLKVQSLLRYHKRHRVEIAKPVNKFAQQLISLQADASGAPTAPVPSLPDAHNVRQTFVRTAVQLHTVTHTEPSNPIDVAALLPSIPVAHWLREQAECCSAQAVRHADGAVVEATRLVDEWRTALQSSATFLGVWDKKFLLFSPRRDDLNSSTFDLIVCDQHALHERTRLEFFISNMLRYVSTKDTSLQLPDGLAEIVWRHSCSLSQLGWRLRRLAACVVVVGTPVLTVEDFVYEFSSLEALRLTAEEVHEVHASQGADVVVVPSVFLDALVSRSCRGALMFGDKLSDDDAVKLVSAATQHVNNFLQCSHGRPSFATTSFRSSSISTGLCI